MKKLLVGLFALLAAYLVVNSDRVVKAGVVCTLPFNLQNNTIADATQVMANYNQLVTCLGSAAAAGVNSDITSLLGLTTPIPYTAGGSSVYIGGTSTGSANAQVVATPTPISFSLTAGKQIIFIAGFTNTSATTLNINSTGATNLFRLTPSGPIALTGGEVVAGNVVEALYDGTRYVLINSAATVGAGPLTNVASASATDLGLIPSHNVNITGTTTINSFGSSAVSTYPVYRLTFAGAMTLTYNATSLILPGVADITTAVNDTAIAIYLGSGNWQLTSYQRASGASVVSSTPTCSAQGLNIFNNAGTPNTKADVTAVQAVLLNTSNVGTYVTSASVTIDITTNGANGLDTGGRAASTVYNIYLINNGTTTAGLASLSTTAPTLPATYTFKCRLGAMITDGSSNFFRTIQKGATTKYTISAALTAFRSANTGFTGSATVPTYTAITVAAASGAQALVPTTATRVAGYITCTAGNTAGVGTDVTQSIIAPNASYGSITSITATPYFCTANVGGTGTSSSVATYEFLLEATTVQYAASTVAAGGGNTTGAAATLLVSEWRDNVNAN